MRHKQLLKRVLQTVLYILYIIPLKNQLQYTVILHIIVFNITDILPKSNLCLSRSTPDPAAKRALRAPHALRGETHLRRVEGGEAAAALEAARGRHVHEGDATVLGV